MSNINERINEQGSNKITNIDAGSGPRTDSAPIPQFGTTEAQAQGGGSVAETAGGSDGGSSAAYDPAAAAAAAALEAARNTAMRQANDKKIAENAQSRQRAAAKSATGAKAASLSLGNLAAASRKESGKSSLGETVFKQTSPTPSSSNQLDEQASSRTLASNDLETQKAPKSTAGNSKGRMIGKAGSVLPGSASVAPSESTAMKGTSLPTTAKQVVESSDVGKLIKSSEPGKQKKQKPFSEKSPKAQRKAIDRFFKQSYRTRRAEAKRKNDKLYNLFDLAVQQDSKAKLSDFGSLDAEEFDQTPPSLSKLNNRNYDNPDEQVVEKKRSKKQDRLIDRFVRDLKIGFFHVATEHLVTDPETGEESLRWSDAVEKAMLDLGDYLGLSRDVNGQRTIFRLVRLYASLSLDRHGKMFKEDKNEWKLSEDEFIDITRLILRSCMEHGHPMAAPFATSYGRFQLGGTEVFPCGVMPKVVAQAITGPNSKLNMSASELVEAVGQEWVSRTYPTIKANLSDSNPSQLVVLEDVMRAAARIDNVNVEQWGISNEVHNTLDEYQDILADYATAMNGNWNSKECLEYSNKVLSDYRKQRRYINGEIYDRGALWNKRTVDIPGQKANESAIEASLNFITGLAKANSIASRPILAFASIAEKGNGDLKTYLALKALGVTRRDGGEYVMSKRAADIVKSDRFAKHLDAMRLLWTFGPGAARLFAQTNQPCNHENVQRFLQENYFKDTNAPGITEKMKQFQEFSQKILVGDYAFNKVDTMLWYQSLLLSHQAEERSHRIAEADMSELGPIERLFKPTPGDQPVVPGSVAYTADEIEDMLLARNNDIGMFFTDMLKTDAGINAYNMMRSNNIGQVNPISHAVDMWLRSHPAVNTLMTLFIDSFPVYGINFVYSLLPMSRTFTYLAVRQMQKKGNTTIGDLTIGGNISNFYEGLRMNLIFDAVTLGHNLALGVLLASVWISLGFEPPDEDRNIYDCEEWKIGGVAFREAWWLNDLTLLSMPIAFGLAVKMTTDDTETAKAVMSNSLHKQLDGNVLLDFMDIMTGWRRDLVDYRKLAEDPDYRPEHDFMAFVISNGLRAANKLTPGAPLYESIAHSALINGEDFYTPNPGKVYDRSDEWHIENEITTKVSYNEYLYRRYALGNWLLAAIGNVRNLGDDTKTGYFYWQMPAKTMSDPITRTYMSRYSRPEGVSEEEWRQQIPHMVLADIEGFQNNGGVEAAKRAAYGIPSEAREATLDYLYDQINDLANDFAARLESGELSSWDDQYIARNEYYNRRSELYSIIYDYLKNEDIPEFDQGYKQLLTDYDVRYVDSETGVPVPYGEWLYAIGDPNVTAVYFEKGNHPTSILPWTTVDYSDNITRRGFNAETVPYWFDEDYTDLDAIVNGIGQDIIKYGRHEGEVLNDVILNKQLSGEYASPDEPTIGDRSWVPVQRKLSENIMSKTEENSAGYNQEVRDIISGKRQTNTAPNYPTYYPRSTYGGGGSGRSYYTSGGSGSNYNPKIYSNPHSVNSDRASTMYTKTPYTANTSYLRPSVSTKGSREAYRRQDF